MKASKSFVDTASSRHLVTLVIITLLLISSLPSASSMPRERTPHKSSPKEKFCEASEVQQETCQKCAKITKSPLVYPMCCNDDDGVYKWCNDYVYFAHETTSSSSQS